MRKSLPPSLAVSFFFFFAFVLGWLNSMVKIDSVSLSIDIVEPFSLSRVEAASSQLSNEQNAKLLCAPSLVVGMVMAADIESPITFVSDSSIFDTVISGGKLNATCSVKR